MTEGSCALVVTADDLGLTRGVNRAIMRAHRDGVVTSTSLLAVGREFDHAVGLLRAHPGLDVGAHLALVGEDPPLLSAKEVPTLVDRRGHFPRSYRTVVARVAAGRVDTADVRRELAAQLDRIRSTGLVVSHLDTHQHLHLWPGIASVVTDLATTSGVRWVRLPTSRARGPLGMAVRLLSTRLQRRLDAAGLRHTSAYAGLDEAGRMDSAYLGRALAAVGAAATAEINVHPGEGSDPDLARFAWDYGWESELSMLTQPATRRAIDAGGFRLVAFPGLGEQAW
ncbi:MAG: ChbG/HpnK family deacetylase [Dermatophilaceae bacterium]